jgi:hypothetical protein
MTHKITGSLRRWWDAMWRRGRIPSACAIVLCLPIITEAALGQTSVHATGRVGLSYTDNAQGVSSRSSAGGARQTSAFFLTLTPGLALYHDRERSRYLLTYAHPFTFHIGRSNLNTDGDMAAGNGLWLLSPRDELIVGVTANRMTGAALSAVVPDSGASAVNDGRTRSLMVSINEQLSHAFSERWRGRQFNSVSRMETLSGPVNQPVRNSASAGLGLDYALDRDSWGVQSAATFFWRSSMPESTGLLLQPRRQLIIDSFARYRRDLTEMWSCEARLGVVMPSDLSRTRAMPRWGASLFWRGEAQTAVLAYDRTFLPNMTTGDLSLSDTVQFNLGFPLLPSAHLFAAISASASRNQIVSTNQELNAGRISVWGTQAAVSYVPDAELPNVSLTISHLEQHSSSPQTVQAPSLARNTISLIITGHYPPRAFHPVPVTLPQRVDGSDRDPTLTQDTQASMKTAGSEAQ